MQAVYLWSLAVTAQADEDEGSGAEVKNKCRDSREECFSCLGKGRVPTCAQHPKSGQQFRQTSMVATSSGHAHPQLPRGPGSSPHSTLGLPFWCLRRAGQHLRGLSGRAPQPGLSQRSSERLPREIIPGILQTWNCSALSACFSWPARLWLPGWGPAWLFPGQERAATVQRGCLPAMGRQASVGYIPPAGRVRWPEALSPPSPGQHFILHCPLNLGVWSRAWGYPAPICTQPCLVLKWNPSPSSPHLPGSTLGGS